MVEEMRSSLRQIRGHPGFACAVIVTLALSVGATTAVFTLADPMLFRPARVPDPRSGSRPIARLKPDFPIGAATAEMQAILTAVEREHPTFPQGRMARLMPLQDALFESVRTPLLMLLGATGCVLLPACANLAHLFMARLQARRRELGIRLACGAGQWRLARQLVAEAAALAILGGLAALLMAQWTFNVLMARTPQFAHVYRLLPDQLDWRVAGFAAVLVAGALGVFGVMPAFRAARADVRDSLQSGGPSESSRLGVRGDALLIVAQTSVCLP